MNPFRSFVLVCLIAIVSPSVGMSQSRNNKIDLLSTSVVRLTIQRANRSDETAAAVYVGSDQQNAYFITAYHAIESGSNGIVNKIQIQFRSAPETFDAYAFLSFEPSLDLGVVQTSVANLPPNLPQIIAKDVSANMSVQIIGHPAAGKWSTWTGNVQNENTSSDDIHHFTTSCDNSLAGGYSGGPVFDSEGNLLGIHISSEPRTYGIALKTRDILLQLMAWRIPTNNLTTVDAIKELLAHYAEAVTSGSIWNVRALRLMTLDEEKKMLESLRETRGKRFALENCTTPEIILDKTAVSCDALLIGVKERVSNHVTFAMRRYYDRWFIIP